MTDIHQTAQTLYTPAQMFALVSDIRKYPEFLPWCSASEIISETNEEVTAKLMIAHFGFNKSFSTVNKHVKNKSIQMKLVDGPFSHLQGEWRFIELEQGCEVCFDLSFELGGSIIDYALGSVFSQMTDGIVDAFCKRAEVLYAVC